MRTCRSPSSLAAGLAFATLVISCGENPAATDCTIPTGIAVTPPGAIELRVTGDSAVRTADVTSACGPLDDHPPVDWFSGDVTIAVAASGVVRARGVGTTFVGARLGGVRDSVRVEVACDTAAAFLNLEPDTLELAGARSADTLLITARTACDDPVVQPDVALLSRDTSVVAVDEAGVATAWSAGETWVLAQAAGLADSALVRVGPGSGFAELAVGLAPRPLTDIWVSGSHAYTGSLSGEACGFPDPPCRSALYVWRLAGPATPALVDSIVVNTVILNDVKVSADGSFAVFTKEGSLAGITLLDLSDPAHPTVIAEFEDGLENGVHNVWIERIDGRDYVFAAEDGNGGLHVLDVTDPAAPVRVAQFYAGASFVHDVYVRDGLAFVSHWDEGLIILDVGNGIAGGSPAAPAEVGRVVTDGGNVHNAWYWPARRLVFVGEEQFDPAGPGGIHVVDVSDLANPVETAHMRLDRRTVHNFWLNEAEEVLFAAWYGHGVIAVDVSGMLQGDLAAQGRELGSSAPAGPNGPVVTWAPQLHEGLIYASDRVNGVWVLRFEP